MRRHLTGKGNGCPKIMDRINKVGFGVETPLQPNARKRTEFVYTFSKKNFRRDIRNLFAGGTTYVRDFAPPQRRSGEITRSSMPSAYSMYVV